MMRGSSGLCLFVGVDKPTDMTSHQVVNKCREIFGEGRVGHMGTLDPLASGVLPICVGPATRLNRYLSMQDKRYRVRVVFGKGTDTDDAEGTVVKTAPVPADVRDARFARSFVSSLVGTSKQLPPVFSAVKVGGRKSCDEARRGNVVDLKPRDIEIYAADLIDIVVCDDAGEVAWEIDFHVSKGTYIRSLARDMGNELNCPAHVGSLCRTQVGSLGIEECVGLDTLAEIGVDAAIDPLRLLDMRFAYVEGDMAYKVVHGGSLAGDSITLFTWRCAPVENEISSCTAKICESREPACDGEYVALVVDNAVAAIYSFDEMGFCYKAACVFAVGVSRGRDI